jgi:hypothetical protein
MDDFDDLSIEDFSTFDFVEEFFDEEEDNQKFFNTYINSNYDF